MTVGERVRVAVGPRTKDEEVGTRGAGVTVETLLYAALGVLALLLRLGGLATWRLAGTEVDQALAAWNVVGGLPPATSAYSPLLATGNVVLFTLFGASDFIARLLPALFGVALVLSPALLRRRIGRAGALLAGLVLAVSPSVTAASRMLDGRVVALFAGVLLVAGFFRLADGRRSGLILGAIALGLGLLSAPAFYGLLLILAWGGLMLWALQRELGLEETFAAVRRAFHPPLPLREGPGVEGAETSAYATSPLSHSLGEGRGVRGAATRATTVLLIVLLGTAFLINLDGLGAAAGLLPAWLAHFAWGAGSFAAGTPAWSLALYETLPLVFGVAGVVVGVRRREPLQLLLGWWTLAGLLLSLVQGGWQPADLALVAVPLALLAGSFLAGLLAGIREERLQYGEWVLLGLAVPLAAHSFIELGAYARTGEQIYAISSLALPPAIFLVLIVLVVLWHGARAAGRGTLLALALVTFLMLWGNNWLANYQPDTDRRDLFAWQRTEPELTDMVELMQRYGSQQVGDPLDAGVLVAGPELRWLAWPLRDFRDVQYVDLFGGAGDRGLIVTTIDVQPALGDRFSGQDLETRSTWRPAGLQGRTLVRWLLWRDPGTPAAAEKAIIWAQRPAADAATAPVE